MYCNNNPLHETWSTHGGFCKVIYIPDCTNTCTCTRWQGYFLYVSVHWLCSRVWLLALTHAHLWPFREGKISYSDRVQCGVTGEQLWLKINEPTDKDKGKYAIDIFAGEGSVRRVLDLTGQGKGLRCFKHTISTLLLSQWEWTVHFWLEFIISLHFKAKNILKW